MLALSWSSVALAGVVFAVLAAYPVIEEKLTGDTASHHLLQRMLIVPPIAYALTYRACLGLQAHDREVLDHGIETGVLRRLPDGEFIEVTQPLGPVDDSGHGRLTYGGAPVPRRMNQVGGARRAVKGFFRPVERPVDVEVGSREERRGLQAAEEAAETARDTTRESTPAGRPSAEQ